MLTAADICTLLRKSAKVRVVLTRKSISSAAEILSRNETPTIYQDVVSALYGLRKMYAKSEEVKYLLRVLKVRIKEINVEFDSRAVSDALYGLQSMSSDVPEVREMLRVLSPKIDSCSKELSAQSVSMALYGLKSMSSDVAEVREMLRVLSPKIGSCKELLSAQAVGNALYGLQSMSSDVPEVREMLRVLSPKIGSCREALDAQNVGNALYGLIPMNLDSSWRSILSMMFLNIERGLFVSEQPMSDERLSGLVALKQTLSIISVANSSNMLHRALVSFGLLDDFDRLLSSVNTLVEKPLRERNNNATATSFKNRYERKFANHIKESLKDQPNTDIYTNKYLFGFEADVIVRVAHENGKVSVVNFEIDGFHHQRSQKRLFCKYRDSFLRKYGVHVHRVRLSSLDLE
jgi:hypothetical protein